MAIAFGRSAAEAGHRARASLLRGYPEVQEEYAAAWRAWQAPLKSLDRRMGARNTYRVSTAVLRSHESPNFPGGLIASLSIPWGFAKGDDDLGGYHLVWPRDLAETAGGFLACGSPDEALRVLHYLRATQEADGSWPQNCWLDGTPYWTGLQLDECAFPIVLADLAIRTGALPLPRMREFWPMMRKAAGFVLRHGPITSQDRWEENAGYTPFTLAVEIAALLIAARIAEHMDDGVDPQVLRDTADAWNDQIEDWLYVKDAPLCRECEVEGYYVRVAPNLENEAQAAPFNAVPVRNRSGGDSVLQADMLVSTDVLALVRFGLRAADDPRMINTVKVIDHLLKVDLPPGPVWRRYNDDGYGERADGSPFNGTGIGRAWPLLTGERAHYELAAGRRAEAERLLATLEACASDGGLIPEQVWDLPAIPERELLPGTAERIGHAAGMGPCRALEADTLPRRGRGIRSAADHAQPLRQAAEHTALSGVAAGLAEPLRARRAGAADRSVRPCDGSLEHGWMGHHDQYPDTRHGAGYGGMRASDRYAETGEPDRFHLALAGWKMGWAGLRNYGDLTGSNRG